MSLLAPKHFWLHELTYAKVWGLGLLGICLFAYLFNNFGNELMLLISIIIWLCLLTLITLGLHLYQRKKHQHLEEAYHQFDSSTIFDPTKSSASHIIEVQNIEHGETLGEFLLDQNIKLKILSVAQHGGHLLKITQDEHVAYVRTTNLSVDNFQRFMVDGERQPLTDKPIWNIEIAFIGNTRDLFTNVLNAVLEMNKHYPAKLIHDIKVRPYQNLNALFEHNHSLLLHGNKKLISIAYHQNELEITTEHVFENSDIVYTQTITIWLNDHGLICSESREINEDLTVATEDVPLTFIDLPFKENRLNNISIQKNSQDNTATNVLILSIRETKEKNLIWDNKKQLIVDFRTTPISINSIDNDIKNTMTIRQYREQQCYCQYEL